MVVYVLEAGIDSSELNVAGVFQSLGGAQKAAGDDVSWVRGDGQVWVSSGTQILEQTFAITMLELRR